MSTQPQGNLSPREQRRAERQQRRAERWGAGGAWIGGVIFILIGALLLLQNMGMMLAGNWWALFILLPAIGSFSAAWNLYNTDRQISGRVINTFIAGLFFTGLAFALYFNLSLTWIGPIALILVGIGVLGAALFRSTPQ